MKSLTTSINVAVGDWVYSDSPGIWRVYRVLRGVKKFRFNLHERQRIDHGQLIFSKRLVDEAWEPAFTNESVSGTFVCPLSDGDRKRLDAFTAKNPKILREFEAFRPKEIDFITNLHMSVPPNIDKDSLQNLIRESFRGIETGMTNDEILERIALSQLANYVGRYPINATLQLRCKDHELYDNEYVFRDVQLLMA